MNKLDWWFFFGLLIIVAIACGVVSKCNADTGNVMVYGNLPPWKIIRVNFAEVNGTAGVMITERNEEKTTQYKSREGWVYYAPEVRISFHEVFNLLYDAKSHWIYFRFGESRIPCAHKKVKRWATDTIEPVKTGCVLVKEDNMVWLTLGE